MLNLSAGHREREKELLCDINDLIKICLFGNVLTVHIYYFEGNNFFFSPGDSIHSSGFGENYKILKNI